MKSNQKVKLSTMLSLHLEYIEHSTNKDSYPIQGSWFRNIAFSQKQIQIHLDMLTKIQRAVTDLDEKYSDANLRFQIQTIMNGAFEQSITLFKEQLFEKNQGSGAHTDMKYVSFNAPLDFNNLAHFEKALRDGNGTVGHRILHISKKYVWMAALDLENLKTLALPKLNKTLIAIDQQTLKAGVELLPLR